MVPTTLSFLAPAMLGGSHGAVRAGAGAGAGAGGRKTFLVLELIQVHLLLPALEAAEGHFTPAGNSKISE